MNRIKIGSKYQENLERLKGLVKLAVGNDALEDFTHFYSDEEKRIFVEPGENKVRISIFYKKGLFGKIKKEIYTIPYSKLIKI